MNKNKIHLYLLLITYTFHLNILAQVPNNYYSDATGKKGYELKTALHNIIKDHNQQTYASLWAHFNSTDAKTDGKVWDMYTDIPNGTPFYTFTFTTDQCGNYSAEGDCYNREHSWPKSWFNDGYPMYTDLFHLYPTDGKVNGERGNYPFGEVKTAQYTSSNQSKRGPCNDLAYSGIVFEPIDAYKGDFARTYFYMATRYENTIATWEKYEANGDAILDGTSKQVFEQWYLNLLFKWHSNDPVSAKETDRNNAVYLIQGNRNPFIDHPEFVMDIWFLNTSTCNAPHQLLIDVTYAHTAQSILISSSEETISQITNIELFSLSGKIESSLNISRSNNALTMDVNNLKSGIYIIRITMKNQTSISKKIAIY
jgi:endonuclease I